MTTDLERSTDPADPAPSTERPSKRSTTRTAAPSDATAATGSPRAGSSSKASTASKATTRRSGPAASRAAIAAERPASTPRAARLPWVLALLGLVGTLGFGLAWQRADGRTAPAGTSDGPAAEMLAGAEGFATALTTFDGATIDRDFDGLIDRAAGDFRSQADGFFSSEVRAQLKEAQASSRGEVRSAFVQSQDGDRGSVFVVVDQTIANNLSPTPKADTLRMELGMVLDDGTWKVQRVDVLTAPAGGTTGAVPDGAAAEPPATGGG